MFLVFEIKIVGNHMSLMFTVCCWHAPR